MKYMKVLFLAILCISVFVASAANASVICCMNKNISSMTISAAMEVPCHNVADLECNGQHICEGCDCAYSFKMNLSNLFAFNVKDLNSNQEIIQAKRIVYKIPQALYRPPIALS